MEVFATQDEIKKTKRKLRLLNFIKLSLLVCTLIFAFKGGFICKIVGLILSLCILCFILKTMSEIQELKGMEEDINNKKKQCDDLLKILTKLSYDLKYGETKLVSLIDRFLNCKSFIDYMFLTLSLFMFHSELIQVEKNREESNLMLLPGCKID